MAPDRILIVDRESKIIHLLREVFTGAGYAVLAANRADRAVSLTAKEQPALVILELDLAGEEDGFEVLRAIRQFSNLPIVILSGRAESADILRAFELGADDYVVKPFDPKVLLARIHAVLRRCQGRAEEPAEIVCDHLVIQPGARRVTAAGVEVYLTETEYNLLLELARHRNRVLMHEQLLTAVWGPGSSNEVDYLRSYIHVLRRKLEYNPARPNLIISRPGVGYMLVSTQSEG